jgi:hypothetical protein
VEGGGEKQRQACQAYRPTRLTTTAIQGELVLRIPRFGISKPDLCWPKCRKHDQKPMSADHVVGKLRLKERNVGEWPLHCRVISSVHDA